MEENSNLFRKKSMERLSGPEDLNEYLHVTNPAVWAVIIAIAAILTGLFIWSAFTSVNSFIDATGKAENGVLTVTFDEAQGEVPVEPGTEIMVGDTDATVSFVGRDDNGNVVASAEVKIPDGVYDVKVCYKQTKILSLLFNM